jgi:hypothetical protein
MNKLAWTVAAAMLGAACVASAASADPDASGTAAARDAGAIYEWVDDSGRMHASDTVPEKYKSVAKRIDPNRTRLPADEQEAAERQAAALKAKAASAVALSPNSTAAQGGAARPGYLSASTPGPDTVECAAWRRQVSTSRECFVAFSNRHGAGVLRSCSNEPDPPPPAGCTP